MTTPTLGLPKDIILKSGVGFGRGPKAGHKYWRRVRVLRQGKLSWDYYYNDPKSKAQYFEDQARRHKRAKKHVVSLEEEAHKMMGALKQDLPELTAARADLRELTTTMVSDYLGWDRPPVTTISPKVAALYTDSTLAYYDDLGGEPDDLYGKKLHPLRALELALKSMPPSIHDKFGGAVSDIKWVLQKEDKQFESKYSGFFTYASREIALAADAIGLMGGGGAYLADFPSAKGLKGFVKGPKAELRMRHGMTAVETIVHEFGHAVHSMLGGPASAYQMPDDYDGPNWEDWIKFLDGNSNRITLHKGYENKATGKKIKPVKIGVRGGESGITKYSDKNVEERFAECFMAAVLWPKQLAATSPKTYNWFREVLGHDAMRPIESDEEESERLQTDLEAATSTIERRRLAKLIEKSEGINDIDWDDDRLKWWTEGKPKPLSTLLASETPPSYDAFYKVDPPDGDQTGQQGGKLHDRFFEMNYRGRTVYVRYGQEKIDGGSPKDFDPERSQAKIELTSIKEVYDENRQPIDKDLVYWHLMQDQFEDADTSLHGKLPITIQDAIDHPKGLQDYLLNTPDGNKLRDKQGIHKIWQSTTSDSARDLLDALERGVYAYKAGKGIKIKKPEEKLKPDDPRRAEMEALLHGSDKIPPMPILMRPTEITANAFRQRSGTFVYDRWAVAGGSELAEIRKTRSGPRRRQLLDALRKKQPGLAKRIIRHPAGTKMKDPKTGRMVSVGGRIKENQVMFEIDPRTGDEVPVFDRMRYVNANPDGTKTVIDAKRDKSGKFRITDPMWSRLLTPHGEAINSADDLRRLCAYAAAEKRSTWVSIRTDRKRVQDKNGRWTMAKKGDTEHFYHMEVQFDGHGQPRILGKEWQTRLEKKDPRLDDLLKDDPFLTQFRADARPIVEGEQIRLSKPKKKDPKRFGDASLVPVKDDRVLLRLSAEETRAKKAKTIVARLDRIVLGKKAGEAPPEPGWDRMPDPYPFLREEEPMPDPQKRLSQHERSLIKRGVLPEWYVGTKYQKEWYHNEYKASLVDWKDTFEAKKAEGYDTVYVFKGEVGGGSGGRTYYRNGTDHVLRTTDEPITSLPPEPLKSEPLVYMHHEVDPVTGMTVTQNLRLILPSDGHISPALLADMPGVTIEPFGKNDVAITITKDGFNGVRNAFGAVSLTGEVDRYLKAHIDMLVTAEKRMKEEAHGIELDEIDPGLLADLWGAGLQRTLPNGRKFEMPHHQKVLEQKLIDNDGRCMAAHYMGTGKTVEAIVAIKMMQARPYREKPTKKQREEMTSEQLKKWWEDHPWDYTRKDPDNPKRVLVVAPLQTVEQWRQAADDFDEGALVVGSGRNHIPIEEFLKMSDSAKGDLVIIGPEYFTTHADALKEHFDGLVVDEVHLGIKNEEAQRNMKVREWNDQLKMMLLLTGTPMTRSPTDFVEYIKLLSNGDEWADMDAAKFTKEYLEESPIPGLLGLTGKAPKLKVRDEKRGELAAILSRWMDIALPKDVRGSTLPAVRIEENKFAEMTGAQEKLYNLYMANLGGDADKAALDWEEIKKLKGGEKRLASAAKAISNNIGYKAGDTEKTITFDDIKYDKAGKATTQKVEFRTFDPVWLMSKKSRGKNAGKWPTIDEIGPQRLEIYNVHLAEMLGRDYSELSGLPIGTGMLGTPTKAGLPSQAMIKAQTNRMKKDGWPRAIDNPEAGELGVRFRGHSISWIEDIKAKISNAKGSDKDKLTREMNSRLSDLDQAIHFQRDVRSAVEEAGTENVDHWGRGHHDNIVHAAAVDWGIEVSEAVRLLHAHPRPSVVKSEKILKHSGDDVHLSQDDNWVSDDAGSLHLLYMPNDWDKDAHKPKSAGGFAVVTHGDFVTLSGKGLRQAGIAKPKRPTRDPVTGLRLTSDERANWDKAIEEWTPPQLRYDESTPKKDGKIGLINQSTGGTVYVNEKEISAQVKCLFDPGMRQERNKLDMAMTHQNAKCDELEQHIKRFHAQGGGPGSDGERQMVLFGNGILDSCRTMEGKLRQMGFRDVNEIIEGSPHHDPDDPTTKGHQGPNGKYFVTYIGSTYTGNRDLNVAIFQKVKDANGFDSETSLFVQKLTVGRPPSTWRDSDKVDHKTSWSIYPGDVGGEQTIAMSQWSPEQRDQIRAQFKIDAPESYVTVKNGDGTATTKYFYGTVRSAAVLRAIALTSDPVRVERGIAKDRKALAAKGISDAAKKKLQKNISEAQAEAKEARKKIADLKAEYTKIAQSKVSGQPPLSKSQITVFNNCELMVCSDAAQVGMNLGNAAEMVKYDSLASPMAEAQRTTRCARMLPPAVHNALMGKPVMTTKLDYKGKPVVKDGQKVMVQKFDDVGRPIYDGSGPFSKLREMERGMFEAGPRAAPGGVVSNVKLATGDSIPNEITFTQALDWISSTAEAQITDYSGSRDRNARQYAREWEVIRNKVRSASVLGGNAQYQALVDLTSVKMPGSNEALLHIPAGGITNISEKLESGTYDGIQTLEPTEAIRRALSGDPVRVGNKTYQITEEDRTLIAKYALVPAQGGQVSSHDAASIYKAIRASEILTHMENERDSLAVEMRSRKGGEVVTDSDVENALIDSLTPADRAILKTCKYLVNVRRLAVSAHTGQVRRHRYRVKKDGMLPPNAKGEELTAHEDTLITNRVFTGYEREYPIGSERRTRAMGRARMLSFEEILSDIQNGTEFVPEGHFEQLSGGNVAALSSLVQKAFRLIFDLRKHEEQAWQPLAR